MTPFSGRKQVGLGLAILGVNEFMEHELVIPQPERTEGEYWRDLFR
jgi:hypothetical protein